MAKFHRDSIVTSIWEGTSNIQALEVLEVALKKDGLGLFKKYLEDKINKITDKEFAAKLEGLLSYTMGNISSWFASEEPEFYAKEALFKIGNLLAICEMGLVAQKNPGGVFSISSRIFYEKMVREKSLVHTGIKENMKVVDWMGR